MPMSAARPTRLAVIGDIHDQWDDLDSELLLGLGVDLALFVGDFGNESVEVVRRIAELPLPIAAVCGNHDAWYSASEWGRKRCPYDRTREDRVRQQLDLLGPAHVGYSRLDIPDRPLAVVGSRPFSWGGPDWKNADFYREHYGVTGFAESCRRIAAAATDAPCDTLIFLAHNGPFGLGSERSSICGRDWKPGGGDYGDPDLSEAIVVARAAGKHVPLVTFGHMHHRLRHTRDRLRTAAIERDGTVYFNAACAPRHQPVPPDSAAPADIWRTFALVELGDRVREIAQLQLTGDGRLVRQQILYRQTAPASAEVLLAGRSAARVGALSRAGASG